MTILSPILAFSAPIRIGDALERMRDAVMADEMVRGVSVNRFGNRVFSWFFSSSVKVSDMEMRAMVSSISAFVHGNGSPQAWQKKEEQ